MAHHPPTSINYLVITKFILLISALTIFYITLTLTPDNTTILLHWPLLLTNSTNITLTVILDPMNTLFSFTISFISFNVFLFTKVYMHDNKTLKLFYQLILAFILSINLLIFSPNLIVIILGWDGLGLTSFLLVIYYQTKKTLAGGILTALTNRIGDVIIILAIAITFDQGHWLSSSMWQNTLHYHSPLLLTLLIAAITKRAQYPFSAWLPAAIAAPTPVSALVHSSTLVTAGIFLLLRFHPFLSEYPLFNNILIWSSAFTTCFIRIAATAIIDTKKIVALSTASQLGLIIFTLRLNMPHLTLFHLITHAIFKALLFLSLGVTIIITNHQQNTYHKRINIRNRINTIFLYVSTISLTAVPFMGAFLSKDPIIESIIFNPPHLTAVLLIRWGTTLTISYRIRIIRSSSWKQASLIINRAIIFPQPTILHLYTPILLLSMAAILTPYLTLLTSLQTSIFTPLPLINQFIPIAMIFLGYFLTDINTKLKTCLPSQTSSYTSIFLAPIPQFTRTLFLTNTLSKLPISPSHTLSLASLQLLDIGWYEFWGPQISHYLLSLSSSYSLKRQQAPYSHFILLRVLLTPFILILTS